MIDRGAVRAALIERLRPKSKPLNSVGDETDLYGDLGINGQDLWEIFAWAAQTYGADFSSVTPEDYDINEPPGRCFSEKPYKRVTVGELLDAIERGRWVVPE